MPDWQKSHVGDYGFFWSDNPVELGAMSDDDKLRVMQTYHIAGHLYGTGGYPYASEWIGEVLVVAGLDPAKDYEQTEICTYSRQSLLFHFDTALENYTDGMDWEGFEQALDESGDV